MVKLMTFLGNPRSTYAATRHNVGWMYVDAQYPSLSWSKKFHGKVASVANVHLLKPETYMNESGQSVRAAYDFYNLKPSELLVVHDDIETAFGTVTLQQGGGLAGHKGLRSIVKHLSSEEFWRLKIGIGRPKHGSVSAFVLQRFSPEETPFLADIFALAASLIKEGGALLPEAKSLL